MKKYLLALVLGFGLLAAACGSDGDDGGDASSDDSSAEAPAPADAIIAMEGFAFTDDITVAAGTEITIENRDDAAHTFTEVDGAFDTGSVSGGESTTVVIDEPGTYAYFCAIHPSMTGTITVTG